ncbi:hypothetical protein PENSPDRAFT_647348 [Peniophora sp. CONT]|nr:hypothetical protein PENSPDRAFT_647348 [Peniophora sp. CONT]
MCAAQTATPKIYELQAGGETNQYIIAALGTPSNDFVLDVEGANPASGTRVILYTKHGMSNQVWVASLAD